MKHDDPSTRPAEGQSAADTEREEEALLNDLRKEGVLTEDELARLLEARRRFRQL